MVSRSQVYSENAVTVRDLGRTLSTESRLSCIHRDLNTASVAGGWAQEAAYACHPACERSDPPPERSFAAAPRYELKVGGGAKKTWVWIRLSTFQDVQKVEVVDPMEEKQACAELLFQVRRDPIPGPFLRTRNPHLQKPASMSNVWWDRLFARVETGAKTDVGEGISELRACY